jgi:transposase
MLRSGSVLKIRTVLAEGKSLREAARELGVSRNTVRRYARGDVGTGKRAKRGSKLEPFKEQVRAWVREDRLLNCPTMLARLRAQGYTGGMTVLKDFVQPLRPPLARQRPVQRYETPPGRQLQVDWGEFTYEDAGKQRKVYGFVAVLGYSRMRYAVFARRCDTPTLLRCLVQACEAFGGLPERVLTDRMKSVLVTMDGATPRWNPLFLELVTQLGIVPSVCRAYTPQTKGKVERSIRVVKESFWPGVTFTDLDDLNRQATAWVERLNGSVHRTTHRVPAELLAAEGLRPLSARSSLDRFLKEERKVSWDGYFSYEGVKYGLPAALALAGRVIQVLGQRDVLEVWRGGRRVLQVPRQQQGVHPHPAQWTDVAPAVDQRRRLEPLGHLRATPPVAARPLSAYDVLYGVDMEVGA